MDLFRSEQEVNINYNAEDKRAQVYACEPIAIRRCRELARKHPGEFTIDIDADTVSITCSCPKSWVVIKPPVKQNLTDEQRAARRASFEKVRAKKDSQAHGEEEDLPC